MLIDQDPGEGAAYIYLTDPAEKSFRTETLDTRRGIVNLDYDEHGYVIGIEVLD